MRTVPLGPLSQGISRLRTKGGANPEGLYDLVNAHLTAAGTVVNRPGTRRTATLPSTTRGLCAFQGKLHTFSTTVQTLGDPFVNHVIGHPEDATQSLARIHFAAPFMGFLYVVAEYANGDIYHYWLQATDWAANTVYLIGNVVAPSVENGLSYKAKRLEAARPLWTASTARALNDEVEPTTANGYYYRVVDVGGGSPTSGSTEPTWPTNEGEQVTESIEETIAATVETATDSDTSVSEETEDRYRRSFGDS